MTTTPILLFGFERRTSTVLDYVAQELQKLRDDPQGLFEERGRRFHGGPPPCAKSPRLRPPVPGFDPFKERKVRDNSSPRRQFQSQAEREKNRLSRQRAWVDCGRRQTLPFDDSMDYLANAENNVRSRWVQQGIWGEEWGPAWPQGSRAEYYSGGANCSPDCPFRNEPKDKPGVYSRWGHEEPDPEPEEGVEPPPGARPETKRYQRRPVPFMGRWAAWTLPTVPLREASRPCRQFEYQISEEREWLKDEFEYKFPGEEIDFDATRAYENVKQNWIDDGIWDSEWGDWPGLIWYHEKPFPFDDEEEAEEEAKEEARAKDIIAKAMERGRTKAKEGAVGGKSVDGGGKGIPKPSNAGTESASTVTEGSTPAQSPSVILGLSCSEAPDAEPRANSIDGQASSPQPTTAAVAANTEDPALASPSTAASPSREGPKRARDASAADDENPAKRLKRSDGDDRHAVSQDATTTPSTAKSILEPRPELAPSQRRRSARIMEREQSRNKLVDATVEVVTGKANKGDKRRSKKMEASRSRRAREGNEEGVKHVRE